MEEAALIISIVALALILFVPLVITFSSLLVAVLEQIRKKRWLRKKNGATPQSSSATPDSRRASWVMEAYNGLYKVLSMTYAKLPINSLRLFLYRHVFKMAIGKKAGVHKGVEIRAGYKISIGARSVIGDDCLLDGRGGLEIGEDVNLSSKVNIFTGQHAVNSPSFEAEVKPVRVGNRAWLSANTIVLPGVVIGEGAVLAAAAVATKDLEPFGMYAGIPAKKISERSKDLVYRLSGCSTWFY